MTNHLCALVSFMYFRDMDH